MIFANRHVAGVQWNLALTKFRMNPTQAYAPALHMQQQPVISNKSAPLLSGL
jgi:hypothetical protein